VVTQCKRVTNYGAIRLCNIFSTIVMLLEICSIEGYPLKYSHEHCYLFFGLLMQGLYFASNISLSLLLTFV
jgi:hypothetical protein